MNEAYFKQPKVEKFRNEKFDKDWVKATFHDLYADRKYSWVPAFKPIAQILQMICECEDEKYPRSKGLKGRDMVIEYMTEAMNGANLEELNIKYEIPER